MTEPELELPPLTNDQRQAIRDCRFVTTNVPRDHAWLVFDDEGIIARLAGVARRTETYVRDWQTGRKEHEALIGHPEAIALVVALMKERAS